MLNIILLNASILNVIFLSAVMLNVFLPNADGLNVIMLKVVASPLTNASKFDSQFQLGICQSVYNAFLLILAKRPSLLSHGEDH